VCWQDEKENRMTFGRRAFLANTTLFAGTFALGARAAGVPSSSTDDLTAFIYAMPKAEMHVHLEGTLEPEMKFRFGRRNGVTLPYKTVEDIGTATTSTIFRAF